MANASLLLVMTALFTFGMLPCKIGESEPRDYSIIEKVQKGWEYNT